MTHWHITDAVFAVFLERNRVVSPCLRCPWLSLKTSQSLIFNGPSRDYINDSLTQGVSGGFHSGIGVTEHQRHMVTR